MKGLLYFGLFFSGIASIFLIVGIAMAESQRRTLANAVPVQVKILESELEEHEERRSRSSGGSRTVTMFSPRVRFEYTVNGQRYEGDDATPLDVSSSDSSDAAAIVSRYQPGTTHTGYHDRADPSQSFLVRTVDFFPYVFILFPLIHFTIGSAVLGLSLRAWEKPRVDNRTVGRAVLTSSPRDAASITWLFATAPWVAIGAFAFWHWNASLSIVGGSFEWWGWLLVGIWAFISLLVIRGTWRAWTLSRKLGEARLTVAPYPLRDGSPVRVEVERDVRSGIDIRGVELLLVAKTKQNKEAFSQAKPIASASDAIMDRTLRGQAEFNLPTDRDSSWTWTWVVRTLIGPSRKHELSIPAEVHFGPAPVTSADISGQWPAKAEPQTRSQ